MLNFGFIGVGHAGGLFVSDAKLKGYEVLAINSAEVDLKSLFNFSDEDKIHLTGFQGAGKNREVGKNAFSTHQEKVVDKIKQKFMKCQVIFPVFSLGGGTGSGLGPDLIQVLSDVFPNKVISPIVFFPSRNEPPRAQMNALESFSELSSSKEIGTCFLIDNDKTLQRSSSNTLKEKYSLTNSHFFDYLNRFNQSTERNSTFGTLDKMDLLTTFTERGNAVFVDITLDHNMAKNPEDVINRIKDSLKHQSFFADFPLTNATNISVLLETPNSKMTSFDIDSIFHHTLSPMELFKGIYVKENCSPTLHILMTGLPFPTDKLYNIEESISQKEELLSNAQMKAQSQQYTIKKKWNDNLKRRKTPSI